MKLKKPALFQFQDATKIGKIRIATQELTKAILDYMPIEKFDRNKYMAIVEFVTKIIYDPYRETELMKQQELTKKQELEYRKTRFQAIVNALSKGTQKDIDDLYKNSGRPSSHG